MESISKFTDMSTEMVWSYKNIRKQIPSKKSDTCSLTEENQLSDPEKKWVENIEDKTNILRRD